MRRVKMTRKLPGGPATAASAYRNFRAVAGVVLHRERAQAHATDRWDGGEMYQSYLASRILAEGLPLLYVDEPLVSMGTLIRVRASIPCSIASAWTRVRLSNAV